jgi:hypothetical protein
MTPPRPANAPLANTPRPAPLPAVPFGLHTRRGQLLGATLLMVLLVPVLYVGSVLRARRASGVALTEAPVPAAASVSIPLAASAPVPGATVRPGIPSLTLGGLPAPTSGDEVLRVVPPTRAGQPADPSRYPPAYTTYTAAPLDRIRLRGGRELTGRVEVVRASTVQFRDGESGLRYEFRKSEIAEITTEFGTRVRFTPDGQPTNATRAASFIASALQERYVVRYGKGSVVGSAACGALWDAPLADDEADVSHLAGADTLTITFRGGGKFTAVVDDEGLFASSVVIVPDQARSSQALITRIEGRFVGQGFDATVHILGYRRARDGKDIGCQSRLPATGRVATAQDKAPSPVPAMGP